MKVVVTSNGTTLEAQAHPAFGRCPTYLFIDTETMQFEAVENPAANAAGGAGIQAAQFIIERGAQAVVTGNVGPNAFKVLQPADVPVYLFSDGTVRQAVEAYKAGELSAAGMDLGHGTTPKEEEIAALRETARELRKQVAEVMERLDGLEAGTSTEGE
jgi:predicted Fe-Mo cluster-binding NifX family protein